MDATTSFIVSGMTGCSVDLVVYDEGRTRLLKTTVECTMPFRLKVSEESKNGIRAARRVMLLAQHEGVALRADGHLSRVQQDDHGTWLEISQVHWEILERRRHVRVPVQVPVTLRLVMEGDEQPKVGTLNGHTTDLSVSGAFIKIDELPPQGTLVEFATELEGKLVRTLAVVAHSSSDPNGAGLHFVEYIDSARYLLHGFLTRAA